MLATLDDGFELNALIREAYGLEMESQKRKLSVGEGRPGEIFSESTREPDAEDDEVTPRRNRSACVVLGQEYVSSAAPNEEVFCRSH